MQSRLLSFWLSQNDYLTSLASAELARRILIGYAIQESPSYLCSLNNVALAVLKRQKGMHSIRGFTYQGKPIKSANTKAWTAALTRAGIDDFRWHDLRHTWATWQRQAGTPTHELQRLGGWRTGAMVERYAHLAPEQLAVAASRLDSVLAGYDLATRGTNEKRPASLKAA